MSGSGCTFSYVTTVTSATFGQSTSFFSKTATGAGYSWVTSNAAHIGEYTVAVTPSTSCFTGTLLSYKVYIIAAGVTVDCTTLSVTAPSAPSVLAYTVGETAVSASWSAFIVTPASCAYTLQSSVSVTTANALIDPSTAFTA